MMDMQMHSTGRVVALACCLVILGILVCLWTGKRRFHRRTLTGVQLFSSYSHLIILTTLESIAAAIGRLLIAAGVVLGLVTWFNLIY